MRAYAAGEIAQSQDLIRAQILHTRTLNQRLKRKALDEVVGLMDHQLDGTRAAPSTPAGQSLVKRGRHEAYLLAK